MIRFLLLLAIAAHASAPAQSTIRVVVAGTPSAEILRGLEFGEIEMAQTTKLLGVKVERIQLSDPDAYGSIVVDGGTPAARRPAIHLSEPRQPRGACDFAIGPPDSDGAELWHSSLERFGASELNERYERRYKSPMTSDAWAGWAAMKALVESALRRRPDEDACAALARLRFDGHKGRPLFFDPDTGVLTQPRYLVKDGRVVGERE